MVKAIFLLISSAILCHNVLAQNDYIPVNPDYNPGSNDFEQPGVVQFPCPTQEDGYYPYPEQSSKFIRCINGIAHGFDCPEQTAWIQENLLCDWITLPEIPQE